MENSSMRWTTACMAAGLLLALACSSARAQTRVEAPLTIAKEGYVFAGGRYEDSIAGRPMAGQLCAEFQIPAKRLHAYPIVMVPGGGQTGTDFTETPDGREGWAQFFLRRGWGRLGPDGTTCEATGRISRGVP
jgi:hypothetical protein